MEVAEEVAVLQALAASPRACQLHDYGLDPGADALVLVLKNYRCSLKCVVGGGCWGWDQGGEGGGACQLDDVLNRLARVPGYAAALQSASQRSQG